MKMLKNYYYRVFKSRTLRKAFRFFAGFLLIAAVVAIASAGKLRTAENRAQFLLKHPTVTKILPVYWQIRKLSDIVYLPYFFKTDDIPNYELVIAKDDLQKMNDSLPEGFMDVIYTDKTFVPGEFRAGGKTYKVRVRYRGANAIHWNAAKRSYLIRFEKDDLFHGLRELNCIIPDDRIFAIEHFNNYRAQKLGLKTPVSGFANLDVNGKGNALYFAIESWSREMLDKWGVGQDSIFYGDVGPDLWTERKDWELLANNPKLSEEENFAPLDKLLGLFAKAGDGEFNLKIFDLVDKDNFYAWQIHQELANSSHQIDANVRMYFDNTKGKFFFVPWDVEIEGPKLRDNFGRYGALAERIFKNPAFLNEKNARLYQYVSYEKNLKDDLEFYDRTFENFQISLYRDRLKIYTNRFVDSVYHERRQEIIDIFRNLRGRLSAENEVRIEDDFNLAYPPGKSGEIFSYLKYRYVDDQSFVKNLGPDFTSSYGDEDFTDTYFDTPNLDLYKRKAGLRYRLRASRLNQEDRKELVQLKLSGDDKFSDTGSAASRNEIKFNVEHAASLKSAEDQHPVMKYIAPAEREEFKARLRELGFDPVDLRPILTINQRRQRVYLNRNGETFISFSMDDAVSKLWWADGEFSQMEVELNEIAYTAADGDLKARMKKIREGMIVDLREHFDYLADDQTIKYTKMFDLLDEHLPGMKFLIRIGVLRGD